MFKLETKLLEELDEQLRFETLLANMSARFINLPADLIDSEIEDAERRICEFLNLDLSALWQSSAVAPDFFTPTHLYSAQEGPQPRERMNQEQFPWYRQQMLAGRIVAVSSLDELPAEAARDRESGRLFGIKSNLCIPLSVGGEPPIGILGFSTTQVERDWPDVLVKRLQLVAQVFASALARKRADEGLRRHEQELSKLTGRIIYAQEEELRRLSRELHDDLTQRLAALSLDAALIEKQLNPVDPQAVQDLRALRANLIEVADEVHDLSRRLHPSILDDLGLVQAVQAECATFVKKTGIDLSFMPHDFPDSVPQQLALCLYRIIQEGLQNIAKHSRAAAASITLQGISDGIRLLIKDKGIGFDSKVAKHKAGIGLSSTRERVRLVNGTIAIESKPGKGTEIQIFIPLVT